MTGCFSHCLSNVVDFRFLGDVTNERMTISPLLFDECLSLHQTVLKDVWLIYTLLYHYNYRTFNYRRLPFIKITRALQKVSLFRLWVLAGVKGWGVRGKKIAVSNCSCQILIMTRFGCLLPSRCSYLIDVPDNDLSSAFCEFDSQLSADAASSACGNTPSPVRSYTGGLYLYACVSSVTRAESRTKPPH